MKKKLREILGIIEKVSFENGPHMIIEMCDEEKKEKEIFVEAVEGAFIGKKSDYIKGKFIKIIGVDFGVIVGECDFGDIGILPLFIAENIKIVG